MFEIFGLAFLATLVLVPCYMLAATTVWPRSKDAPQWAVDILSGLLVLAFLFAVLTACSAMWRLFA